MAPNDASVLENVASIVVAVGRHQEAVEVVQRGRILDPFFSPLIIGASFAQALFVLGRYEESTEAARYCVQRAPTNLLCRESLLRALGETGPAAEARAELAELLRQSPGYTVSEYLRRAAANRRDPAGVARLAEGLRKAGMPE